MENFLVRPRDELWASTPMRFRRGRPLVPELLKAIEDIMASSKVDHNDWMKVIPATVRAWGLEAGYVPPETFNAIGTNVTLKALKLSFSEVGLFKRDFDENVVALNNLWQSSKGFRIQIPALERG